MEIQKAKEKDILEVIYLIRECVKEFNEAGLFHWSHQNPTFEYLQETSKNEKLYIAKVNSICVGMVVIDNDLSKEIEVVEWETKENAINFSHLAVHPNYKDKNIGASLLDYVNRMAHENDKTAIHTYAFVKDDFVKTLLSNAHFNAIAETHHLNQLMPYMAMEKVF